MMSNRSLTVLRVGGQTAKCSSTNLFLQSRNLHATRILKESEDDLMKRIKDDLKNAMRSKDSFASTVFRSLLSEQQYAQKSQQTNGGKIASSMISIIQKALAKRQESAKQFRAANPSREDLAEKEDKEADLIRKFLPEQISKEELENVVKSAIEEAKKAGIDGKKLMGEVMKRVGGQVDKARAPGGLISEAVKKFLQ
ncbi:GatB/YqeY domain-containing protein [Meira miltonrushii]|uniref:Altered inheritance of mitochondria protein 41 n=1 Tax=Meira miltonrushii TaxID=1280837 RepID=A0A316V6W9_9BASI|nr:GatB/YqeY domain-containing protein [Meira miltonrushii]PWN31205.1 GatB/YqeY domain-containing protein [Meira miltonrushii]